MRKVRAVTNARSIKYLQQTIAARGDNNIYFTLEKIQINLVAQ